MRGSLGRTTSAVGTPVTRRPPHRPRRAVFPHRVPRLHSLPRCRCNESANHHLDREHLLPFPAVRLAHVDPAQHVRHEFPLQATCFRQVLPHVRGFPTLRVLRLIRLPIDIRQAFPFTVLLCLPALLSSPPLRFRHNSVSGFPLACLNVRIPYDGLPTVRSPRGLPSSPTHLFLHATA